MRRGFPKGAHFRSAPLADFFGYFLVQRQESNISAPPGILHSKISPQPLWNVERTSVENLDEKNPSTEPVDKFFFSTFALWRKKRWLPNEKWTFPHNFVLRLLRLKKL